MDIKESWNDNGDQEMQEIGYPSEESVKEMTDIRCQYVCIADEEIVWWNELNTRMP